MEDRKAYLRLDLGFKNLPKLGKGESSLLSPKSPSSLSLFFSVLMRLNDLK